MMYSEPHGVDPRGHAQCVAEYYDANTEPFYLRYWDDEEIHFGFFDSVEPEADIKTAAKRMTRVIVEPARIGPAETVVDAGCGVGGAALDVARTFGSRVLGLTVSAVQVTLANQSAERAGLAGRVRFSQADCSNRLPLEDGSCDVVVTIEAACHFADKLGFLNECRRVLRPGGRLVGSDWMAVDGLSEAEYAEAIQPVCEAWRLVRLDSPARWRVLLEDAGFEARECVDLHDAVIQNATILARAWRELLLEDANGCHPSERVALWKQQYASLVRAWFDRRFTIGRFFAVLH